MYVAITRAQRHLSVSCTKTRSKYGTRVESQPSRFFYEMLGEKPPKGWIACDERSSAEKKSDAASTEAAGEEGVEARRRARRAASARGV
jgi:hypothetical protein